MFSKGLSLKEGYDFFKNGNIELLVLKHDIEDNQKEKIISKYVGIRNFVLFNTNIGNKKRI